MNRRQIRSGRARWRGLFAGICLLAGGSTFPGQAGAQEERGDVAESTPAAVAADPAQASEPKGEEAPRERREARVRVTGLWFLQNRSLREVLRVLEPEGRPMAVLDAAFIEDAVLVLQDALNDRGFLRPSGTVHLVLVDGGTRDVSWTAGEIPDLPRDLAATEAEFELEPGVLYHIEDITIEGLSTITTEQALGYYIGDSFLLSGRSARKYTPRGIERGNDSLQVQLQRMGRADAAITIRERDIDHETGAVRVVIDVDEGPLHRVGAVHIRGEVPEAARTQVLAQINGAVGGVYSPLRRQDLLQEVHVDLYKHGYAEARVSLDEDKQARGADEVTHELVLELNAGPLIHVGEVEFAGDTRTRKSVLRRATDVREGDVFDRNRIEADRMSLSSLGVFSAVRADVEPQSSSMWDLTYQLRPSKTLEVGLLAGYGSYEKLRGGLEVFHANQFGRAERGRLQMVESTKSTSAEYQLTIPQLFGTPTSGSVRAFGLDREEVSFDRREVGMSAGIRRHSERYGFDLALRFQYESLRAENVVPDLEDTAPQDSRVGAVTLDIARDRRDNPLSPSRGYELGLALETAVQAIGSEVDYQRLDFRASWHRRIGTGQVIHAGMRHGVIWTFGKGTSDIPINRRFFPGGESTVRGYTEGRAAPRGANGEVIGAEVSTIVNLEYELALLRSISAVVFVDTGLTGATLDDFPGNELRLSAGVGLRYNSIIGPVRLEYGHNLVRESGDQDGELHFSLGFPF